MSVPQAPHAVLCVCTGCLGMEDFTAYAVCLPRYPFLGHHQAHPVLMPRARKVPGSWDSRCAQDILQVLTSWRYSAQCHLFAVEPQMQETWALSGHRAGHLGLHSCWPLGSGEELSPSSSRLFPGLIPATTDKTKLSGHAALSMGASVTAPLYFLGQWSLCKTGRQEATWFSDTAV